jgi:hypothetical protein
MTKAKASVDVFHPLNRVYKQNFMERSQTGQIMSVDFRYSHRSQSLMDVRKITLLVNAGH